jgi:hypothetical protein
MNIDLLLEFKQKPHNNEKKSSYNIYVGLLFSSFYIMSV